MQQTYLCLRRGQKTLATRWKPKWSACSQAMRWVKEMVWATLQGFVALLGASTALLIVATWQDAVAAAASLGCDWRLAGKAPGVPDKWSVGLRVTVQLGAGDWVRLRWKPHTILFVGWKMSNMDWLSHCCDAGAGAAAASSQQRGATLIMGQWTQKLTAELITDLWTWPLTWASE